MAGIKYKRMKTPDGRMTSVHRYVMEEALGRRLRPDEHVHHINHDPLDNRLENLTVLGPAEHMAHHHNKHPRVKVCVICEAEYEPTPTRREANKTCGPACKQVLMARINRERHGSRPVVSCDRCGKEFETYPSRPNARFCSRICSNRRNKP